MLEYSKEEKDVGAGRRRRARMEHTPMKTLYQGGSGEIIEKKSRFIATLESVTSRSEKTPNDNHNQHKKRFTE